MSAADVTALLLRWQSGDQSALEDLTPVVYHELRQIAGSFCAGNVKDILFRAQRLCMKRISGLWASRIFSGKRGAISSQSHPNCFAGFSLTTLGSANDTNAAEAPTKSFWTKGLISRNKGDWISWLDDALSTLAKMSERQSRVVELKFFGGLEIEEIAEITRVSPATIKRDWATARAWLPRELA